LSTHAPDLTGRPQPSPNETILNLLVLTTLLVVCGPLCVVLSAVLLRQCRERQERRTWLLCAISGALGGLFIILMSEQLIDLLTELERGVYAMLGKDRSTTASVSLWQSLLPLWLWSVLLAPLGAILAELRTQLDEIINGTPLAKSLEAERRAQAKREERAGQQAERDVRTTPKPCPNLIGLGSFVAGKTDPFRSDMGIIKLNRWLAFNEQVLDQNLFILGAPGAGKSETIKRLIWEILHNTQRDLILVDGKGEEPLALTVRAIAHATGRGEAPIFRMGFGRPGARYNGFSGDAEAIYSRLVAMSGVMELEGNADIYGRITREILQLVCYAPDGPPHSFEELRQRLTVPWLQATYKNDPVEGQLVKDPKELAQRLEGVQLRLRPLIRQFIPSTGVDGFTVEGTRAAIFSIRTQSMSDTASHFLQFLIEDLKDFIGKRQERDAVLIIDEFGAFGNQNIIKLLSLARSAKLGIVLATQDVANLGDETTMRTILATTGTKLLMRSDFPEDIAKLAGTMYQLEGSVQYEQGQATGLGSVRPQHTFKIDMNEAAQLRAGEGFLIRHRQIAKLKIAALDEAVVAAMQQTTPPEPTPTEPSTPATAPEPSADEGAKAEQATGPKNPKKTKNID
jgi:hypothetical protein